MNNLENSIKDCISKELEKGIIEEVLREKLKESIEEAVKDLFGWSGDIKKVIENKIKSVMIPYLENYDYSKYIAKLDTVLVNILKDSAVPNKKLLENFSVLLSNNKIEDKIKITDIFNEWCKYCKAKTSFCACDDEELILNLSMNIEDINNSWSSFETKQVTFECEQNEDLNVEFIISRYKNFDEFFTITWNTKTDLESIKNLSNFDIFMMKISQAYTKIEVDRNFDNEEVSINSYD